MIEFIEFEVGELALLSPLIIHNPLGNTISPALVKIITVTEVQEGLRNATKHHQSVTVAAHPEGNVYPGTFSAYWLEKVK